MATNETVNIWVKVKGDAAKAIGGITSQLKKNDSQVKKNAISWKSLAVAAGGMAVLVKVNRWMGDSIKLAQEQEKAERKLSASLGYTSKALLEYASALQKKTTYGDEETIASAALVANFVKEEEQIKRIIRVSQDLATAKGMSLSQATDLVTKSVASSTNALSRYGIEIDGAAGSVERIDSAVQALDTSFGGMAEAMALTTEGKITQMENEIGDLREEVGKELLPAMLDVKQATLDFYNVILNNKGAVVGTIRTLSKLMSETVQGWDYMLNGKSRAAEVQKNLGHLKAIQDEVKRLDKEIGLASDNYESYLSAGGNTDQKVLDNLDAKIEKLSKEKELALGLLNDLNNASQGRQTEAEVIDKSTSAIDSNTVSTRENNEEKQKFVKIAEKTMTWQEILLENDRQMLLQRGEDEAIAGAEQEAAERERLEQRRIMAVDFAQQTANQVQAIMSAVNNRRQQDLANELAEQKAAVKSSGLSAKQKATAIEKIEEDAAKKAYELRLKSWRQDLVMSIANTALAVTKTMATMGYPAGIPFAAAAGVTGNISTGIIAANRPKMYNGGELTNKSGMQGDVVPFIGRAGETVVTPEEKKAMQGNGGNTITIGAPQITIQGNADAGTSDMIGEQLQNYARTIEDMFTSGAINPNIINGALTV